MPRTNRIHDDLARSRGQQLLIDGSQDHGHGVPSPCRPDTEEEPVRIHILELANPNDHLDPIEIASQRTPQRLPVEIELLRKLPNRSRTFHHPESLRNLLPQPRQIAATPPNTIP